MKLILDAFGGDHAPEEIVKGGILALEADPALKLVLTGKGETLTGLLSAADPGIRARTEVVDAPEVITNDESPTEAVRAKKNSSLVRAFERLKEDPEIGGLVSAGSTGAVLTAGLFKLGRIRGVNRPALAPLLPTLTGGQVALVDCGANVDCKPLNLCQFALMGGAYVKAYCGVKEPRVALLSNGTEDKKGNELNKEAFPLLKALPGIRFVGNMEARELLSGDFDVAVTDGFAGNICLKSYEGMAKAMMTLLKEEMLSSFKNKMGAMLLKGGFKKVAKRMDYASNGGALLVGLTKVVVKSHGSSKAVTISSSLLQAKKLAESGMVDEIAANLAATAAE